MAYGTDNLLFKNLQQLEEQLANINPHCKLKSTIYADSVGEMSDTRRLVQNRGIPVDLFHDAGVYHFEYVHPKRPNILMRVSTK